MTYDAVVVTGGRGSRLGGVDKAGLVVGGRTVGERVLAAVADAGRRVVVGAAVPGADVVTREEPPGGGPVAGLAAGAGHVRAAEVAVLGGDLPFLTAAVVAGLRAARGDADVAVLVDDRGRDQYLCAVWSASALRAALAAAGGPGGVPLRAVYAAAGPVVRCAAPAGGPPPWFDCDTEQDLTTARDWARGTT